MAKHKIKTSDYSEMKNPYIDKGIKAAGKAVKKGVNKVVKKQLKLQRDYMRLYNKLDMYGQAPVNPLSHPWQRDIDRLKNRWETVKAYARVYRNFENAVQSFNAEYLQNVAMPEINTNINTRTLEILRTKYEQFKKERNAFKRKVKRENDIIASNLKNLLKIAFDYSAPTHHSASGEQTPHQQMTQTRFIKLKQYLDTHFFNGNATPETIDRIKQLWGDVVDCVNTILYDSKQDRINEAWAKLTYIIGGDGMREDDIGYLTEDEQVIDI